MRDIFLIYDGCCFYEIVTLSYFMRYAGCELVFCAPEKKPVRAMEGFTVQPDLSLEELDCRQVRSLIVPGGRVLAINRPEIHDLLRTVRDQQGLIAGICAGVDVLDDAGILHAQGQNKTEKQKLIEQMTVLLGAVSPAIGILGGGLMASVNSSWKSSFYAVTSLKAQRRYNAIYLNEPGCKNIIYVDDRDFDFVWSYIKARCDKAKIDERGLS